MALVHALALPKRGEIKEGCTAATSCRGWHRARSRLTMRWRGAACSNVHRMDAERKNETISSSIDFSINLPFAGRREGGCDVMPCLLFFCCLFSFFVISFCLFFFLFLIENQ